MELERVADQLAGAGLDVAQLNIDGRLHRVKVDGDKGRKTSGWYVLHEHVGRDGRVRIFGAFGNYKTATGSLQVSLEWRGLDETERAAARASMDRARELAADEQKQKAQDAAQRAALIWSKLPDHGSSPYLDDKRVPALGVKFTRGTVVVPVSSVRGRLRGLQFIAPDGRKRFLTGTRKLGGCHLIGESEPDYPIAIAEGYATAASVHVCTGWQVAVAFDAGNLDPVLQALKRQWPDRQYCIAADTDPDTPGNPGMKYAERAARRGAFVVSPESIAPHPRHKGAQERPAEGKSDGPTRRT